MNNKFNPKDVPKWCKWIAVDKDGECAAYADKPVKCKEFAEWCILLSSEKYHFVRLYKGKPPKNWKDELYTWK